MKFITFTVPCYNSAAYMKRCLNSLLAAGEDAEIIIVNDGSTDNTAQIANAYANKYPNIIKVFHKENGGHGSGVNYGIQNATGLYFKVVDSDDWVDGDALRRLMKTIKELYSLNNNVDAFVCNYVYEHVSDDSQYVVNYRNVFPRNRVFTWKNFRPFRISQFLMMHALVFRTQMLKDNRIVLPEHTFYVDNIFVCSSLPHVRKFYYLDEELYRYYIGRADQSVNKDIFMKRIDQHIRITNIIIDEYDMKAARNVDRHLERYITRHIAILCATASVYLTMRGDEESMNMRTEFWKRLKTVNPELYKDVRLTTFSGLTDLPGRFGRFLITKGYNLSKKLYKYN